MKMKLDKQIAEAERRIEKLELELDRLRAIEAAARKLIEHFESPPHSTLIENAEVGHTITKILRAALDVDYNENSLRVNKKEIK